MMESRTFHLIKNSEMTLSLSLSFSIIQQH